MKNTTNTHQPKALPFLFLTEMWERFGFYVVQGLLVLYMTQSFGFSDNESYTLLGVFTALVYISPIVGGLVASHLLGFKTAIVWGGLFLVFGYFLLALPYPDMFFYPGLAIIIVGNGLFKPNISSLLGTQYTGHDPRRDSGFTIFYIGINVGALLAGFSSGYIKDMFGWGISFALASIGLMIGLAIFCYGLRYIKDTHKKLHTNTLFKLRLLAYCLLAAIAICFLLKINALAIWLLPCVGVLLMVYLTVLTLQHKAKQRKDLITLNILIISSIVFWMLFLQIFYSANLFVDRLVDKQLFGIPLSTTVFYATESLFVILLGPLFAWSWNKLGKKKKNPEPVNKFAAGIFFTGLGFVVLAASTLFPNGTGFISPLWVFSSYFLITIGELLLSPIGLSAVTLLSPEKLTGMMMGVWFVANGFGGIFAGWLARMSSVPNADITITDKLAIYQSAFLYYAYIAFFVAFSLFLVQVALKHFLRTR